MYEVRCSFTDTTSWSYQLRICFQMQCQHDLIHLYAAGHAANSGADYALPCLLSMLKFRNNTFPLNSASVAALLMVLPV